MRTQVVLVVLLTLSIVHVCCQEVPQEQENREIGVKTPAKPISVDALDSTEDCNTPDKREDKRAARLANLEERLADLEGWNKNLEKINKYLEKQCKDLDEKDKALRTQVFAVKTELVSERQKREEFTCKSRRRPKSCQDLMNTDCAEGVLELSDQLHTAVRRVYCDGPWLVFQKRQNGLVDFYRGWNAYRNGFGEAEKEYWLGLEAVRQLTSSGRWNLRVDLKDKNGSSAYATYSNFRLGAEADHYPLLFDSYTGGTASDSLTYHRGQPFSTKDRDHDKANLSCAVRYHGAWWYKLCHISNLNGQYNNDTLSMGLNWSSWRGLKYSLPFTQMKMKEV